VGFGGLGVFGEVPRFTESCFIKVYKGVLGSLLGDLGPFFVGLGLAMGRWQLQRILGRVPEMSLTLDEETTPTATWGAVLVVNGDLGSQFASGTGPVSRKRFVQGDCNALSGITAGTAANPGGTKECHPFRT
jgi:hypothetical protein